MPHLRWAPRALRDLQRLRDFLRPKSAVAAKRAGDAIVQGVQVLRLQPGIGRPVEAANDDALREWLIAFGDSGYLARYRWQADEVMILAVRHQRELEF